VYAGDHRQRCGDRRRPEVSPMESRVPGRQWSAGNPTVLSTARTHQRQNTKRTSNAPAQEKTRLNTKLRRFKVFAPGRLTPEDWQAVCVLVSCDRFEQRLVVGLHDGASCGLSKRQ